jgi:hypothetical protein
MWRRIGIDFERDVDTGRDTNFEIYYYLLWYSTERSRQESHMHQINISQRSLQAGNRKWEMTLNIKMSSKLIETRF